MMFNSLEQQPADKILALMQLYKEDPRENKIDLGVGVYKDATGQTPIMDSIKKADKNPAMRWEYRGEMHLCLKRLLIRVLNTQDIN